ncbi:MAG: UTP--glucose-1-phosphate uridylyltransferase, partial [Planctomycetota bacterium]
MLLSLLTSSDPDIRDQSLAELCQARSLSELLEDAAALDAFWRSERNLYRRVRALFFAASVHRDHLCERIDLRQDGHIPWDAVRQIRAREFEAAIDTLLQAQAESGAHGALSSALAEAYRSLGLQTLADQVQRSVRAVPENRWMFALQSAAEHPLRTAPALLKPDSCLRESTPVRMDFSHSCWSDIFFLGMDDPDGARVLNASIALAVHGRDGSPQPPVRATLRVIDQALLRLRSVDLGEEIELTETAQVFDFARDNLGLLRAAVVASGLVPPSLEGQGADLGQLLETVIGAKGRGIELVSDVRGIPKGSRLAVSTTLLGALIAVIMRATGQTAAVEGPLEDAELRSVAARAILGEWLGGSGGGWQDSGGLWPGIKRIEGVTASAGDPEHGVSRGCLLPKHHILDKAAAPSELRQAIADSLVLVHGGMAQDVGPVLEMVTERYLLRSQPAWSARQDAGALYDALLDALRDGDMRRVAALTHKNFHGPISTVIPQATNAFTERLIERTQSRFGDAFWGFWMLGGMSGGGMGFVFDPAQRDAGRDALLEELAASKLALEHALPFAMEPCVYDFAIDDVGTRAAIETASQALPTPAQPAIRPAAAVQASLGQLLEQNGFDQQRHEQLRDGLRSGRLGIEQNRLPAGTRIEDVGSGDVLTTDQITAAHIEHGRARIAAGEVAVVTLAGGSGSRWTRGAGVVKALHPFCKMRGAHRSFLELHARKIAKASRDAGGGAVIPQLITSSYLSLDPLLHAATALPALGPSDAARRVSASRSIGLRLIPTARDLRFTARADARQTLDAQAEKVRASLDQALIDWATAAGEASDYTDNLPTQCVHPLGHAYEVPNLLLNGCLAALLAEQPQVRTLFLHNIDTVG